MSLATRCPACGTTFRIEPDQLALADGWARCGRCSTVFDAAAERREHPGEPGATGIATDSGPASAPASPAPSDADAFGAALLSFQTDALPPARAGDGSEAADEADGIDGAGAGETSGARGASSAAPPPGSEAVSPAVPPAPPAFDPWRELPSLNLGADAATPAQAPSTPPVPPAPETGTSWPLPPSGSTEPTTPGPSGVRPAARAESVAPAGVIQAASEPVIAAQAGARGPRGTGGWRRWRLAILLVAAALLALALVAQVLHRQRDAVAAHHPALRPALVALCGMAGCTIEPLRRPGDIAIERATFTHIQDIDRYRLAFALRNQIDVPLAMPAIELSLLDAQERAVVRRVLMPADFGAAEATLPAFAERPGAVSFALDDAGDGPFPRIAGYAMVAFYP